MSLFSFSTGQFAPNERLQAVQETYGALANVEIRARRQQPPHVETHIRLLPWVSIARVTASSLHAVRQSPQVADGNDDITFLIHPGGEGGWLSHLQAHDSLVCTPGRARVVLNEQSGSVDFQGERVNFLSVAFSRARLEPLINDFRHLPETFLPSGEALRHLTRLALRLTDGPLGAVDRSIAPMSEQLLDLASLTLGATSAAKVRAMQGGLRDARLKAIKADINANAQAPLNLELIASRHGISPGYIRALFRNGDTSFTDYLVERRLLRAFDALSTSQLPQRSINDIAYGSGFNNLSWFYRAFKQRFGVTPGQARDLPRLD